MYIVEKIEEADTSKIKIEEFDDFWTQKILEDEIKSEFTDGYKIIDNKKIVGFILFKKIFEEIEIMNIATHKEYRRRNIAFELLQKTIELNNDITKINLEVNENNIPAIKLYEKFNFEVVGKRKKYYNKTDNAIIMKLFLNNNKL